MKCGILGFAGCPFVPSVRDVPDDATNGLNGPQTSGARPNLVDLQLKIAGGVCAKGLLSAR